MNVSDIQSFGNGHNFPVQIKEPAFDNLQYKYECLNSVTDVQSSGAEVKWGPVSSGVAESTAQHHGMGHENFRYLEKMDVNCNQGAITRFHMSAHGKYDFKCRAPDAPNTEVECTHHQTPVTANNHGLIRLIDHNLECPSDSYLSQFKFSTNGAYQAAYHVFHMNYHFTCCKVKATLPSIAQLCRSNTCAKTAQDKMSGGFCLRNEGDCWTPPGTTHGEFEKESMSSGLWKGSRNCDNNPQGRKGSDMMACYELEPQNTVRSSPVVDFDSYEKFRAAVPALMSVNNYAWKISGENISPLLSSCHMICFISCC